MDNEYKYNGETFMLNDDTGCYIKVTLDRLDILGFVGVNIGINAGTRFPYAWILALSLPDDSAGVSRNNVESIEAGLETVAHSLLEQRRLAEERREFDSEAACNALHKWMSES